MARSLFSPCDSLCLSRIDQSRSLRSQFLSPSITVPRKEFINPTTICTWGKAVIDFPHERHRWIFFHRRRCRKLRNGCPFTFSLLPRVCLAKMSDGSNEWCRLATRTNLSSRRAVALVSQWLSNERCSNIKGQSTTSTFSADTKRRLSVRDTDSNTSGGIIKKLQRAIVLSPRFDVPRLDSECQPTFFYVLHERWGDLWRVVSLLADNRRGQPR